MKSKRLIWIIAAVLTQGCGNAQPPVSQIDMEHTHVQKSGNPYYSRTDTSKLRISDAEWKKVLPEDVYYIAREKGTERAFTGKYWDHTGTGTYYCAACGNALFISDAKFASSCGWPSLKLLPIIPTIAMA
jgi:ribosomal protein L37E